MRVWHDTGVRTQRTVRPERSGGLRSRVLILLLILLAPLAAGCLRVHASITVSPDDEVSGEIIAAAKARDDADHGPQFDENMSFSRKVSVSKYEDDDYVGSRASFSGLTFAEVPQLADLSRETTGVDITLRRAGNLVILEGRVDLTTVTDPDDEVTFTANFPGEVTSTNGTRIDTGMVKWKLKPGVVSTMTAQARSTDPSTRSFTTAAIWLGLVSVLVAALIGYLAWRDRDQTSPRFAGTGDPEEFSRKGHHVEP